MFVLNYRNEENQEEENRGESMFVNVHNQKTALLKCKRHRSHLSSSIAKQSSRFVGVICCESTFMFVYVLLANNQNKQNREEEYV